MKIFSFQTLDVFTTERFGGNPLAVVREANGLSTEQMQTIAAEFNYSETSFVSAPKNPRHDACVRIFTPAEEMPFAGHPNVGTAWALALANAESKPDRLLFEEKAGLVSIRLSWILDTLVKAEVEAPLPLEVGASLEPSVVAECLGFEASRVLSRSHPPIFASVGARFVCVQVETGTLPHLNPSSDAFKRHTDSGFGLKIFAYERRPENVLEARMFWPAGTVREDPATGSASAALVALLASLSSDRHASIEIWQGRTMGRLSHIHARAEPDADGNIRARIAGACVPVMQGNMEL